MCVFFQDAWARESPWPRKEIVLLRVLTLMTRGDYATAYEISLILTDPARIANRPVSRWFLRVKTDSTYKPALALPRPTAAHTAALALQRHHCGSHCHLALLV